MVIAIIFPSNGFINELTASSLLVNLGMADSDFYPFMNKHNCTHNCYNDLIQGAIEIKADYMFFIEGSLYLEDDVLVNMLKKKKSVVFHSKRNPTKCMLIKRKVFRAIKYPYFTSKEEFVDKVKKKIDDIAYTSKGIGDVKLYSLPDGKDQVRYANILYSNGKQKRIYL